MQGKYTRSRLLIGSPEGPVSDTYTRIIALLPELSGDELDGVLTEIMTEFNVRGGRLIRLPNGSTERPPREYRHDPVAAERERRWKLIRRDVLERDSCTCRYCGTVGDYSMAVDHVIPASRGGTDTLENLVAACKSCNSAKGNRTPEEWHR